MEHLVFKVRTWILNHPMIFALMFLCFYMVWFTLLENHRGSIHWIRAGLDNMIPFCEYFIIPYLLWFAYVGGTFLYFYLNSKKDMINISRYLFTGLVICLTIYTVYPTGIHLRPASMEIDNVFKYLVSLIYSLDTSTNVCPSIHVYASLVTNAVIENYEGFKRPVLVKASSLILCILICLSTVMLKQHSVIDVFWGSALALALSPLATRSFTEIFAARDERSHVS